MTTYKIFKIGDLFDYETGDTDLKKSDLTANGYPLVSSGFTDRGVIGKTSKPSRIHRGGAITVDMFGYAYYRQKDFKMVTHARVFALYLKDGQKMTDRVGLYLASCLAYLPKLFSYSYMCNFSKISGMNIVLPIDESTGEPDWGYMDRYIQEIEDRYIQEIEDYFEVAGIDSIELTDDEKEILQKIPKFHEFRIGDLFDINSTKKTFHANSMKEIFDIQVPNTFPYVVRQSKSNGIRGYIQQDTSYLNDENTISFAQDTGVIFYQEQPYFTGRDIKILSLLDKSVNLSAEMSLYLTSALQRSFILVQWGQLCNLKRISNTKMKLPVKVEGNLDWDYMNDYIHVLKKVVIQKYANSQERKIMLTKELVKTTS